MLYSSAHKMDTWLCPSSFAIATKESTVSLMSQLETQKFYSETKSFPKEYNVSSPQNNTE